MYLNCLHWYNFVDGSERQTTMSEESIINLAEMNLSYWCGINAYFTSTLMENKNNVASV